MSNYFDHLLLLCIDVTLSQCIFVSLWTNIQQAHAAPSTSVEQFQLTATNPDIVSVQTKFHYTICMVADRSEAGRGPVADLLARASSLLAS